MFLFVQPKRTCVLCTVPTLQSRTGFRETLQHKHTNSQMDTKITWDIELATLYNCQQIIHNIFFDKEKKINNSDFHWPMH